MALLLGIDLGTSYLKAGVFDESGRLRGMGRVSTGVREPRPGWKELDVAEFLQHLREAVRADGEVGHPFAFLEGPCLVRTAQPGDGWELAFEIWFATAR